MKANRTKILLVAIFLAAGVLLFFGWKLFWFLTDDALIAFRYVSNSISGYGYVWNPPPFKPVEGYTSFLWVLLLDFIWRVFNIKPPEIVNYLSLGFSYLTLLAVAVFVLRLQLRPGLARLRPVWLGFVLLFILTNRTFLAWSSSGMETAMFNFFLPPLDFYRHPAQAGELGRAFRPGRFGRFCLSLAAGRNSGNSLHPLSAPPGVGGGLAAKKVKPQAAFFRRPAFGRRLPSCLAPLFLRGVASEHLLRQGRRRLAGGRHPLPFLVRP
jgi:hypothetical protein